jgi:hypothetical protein
MSNLPDLNIKGLFAPDVSKRDCISIAKQIAAQVQEAGEMTPAEALGQLERMAVIVDEAKKAIKPLLTQSDYGAGVQFTMVNGRRMPQFEEDDTYRELKEKLKSREELLKSAINAKEEIYDSEGVQVPRVSMKFGADYFTAKF